MIRELPTTDSGFSRAFVKPINEISYEDFEQLKKHYYNLRALYKAQRDGLQGESQGWRIGVYKEIKDIEYFFTLTGQTFYTAPYEITKP